SKEDRCPDDVVRLTVSPQRGATDEGVVRWTVGEEGRGEARLDQARGNRVDADAARPQFPGQGTRQTKKPRLADAVRSKTRQWIEAGNRAKEDDRTLPR